MENIINLRKLEEKDIDGMLEWMHEPESERIFCFQPERIGREDAAAFIKKAAVLPVDGKSIHYAVADSNDEYLGTISLKNIDLVNKHAEYAISLREKARGTGIARAATKELLDRAFLEFGLEKVYLYLFSENIRAARFYEKFGFIYEGISRNHFFIKDEFKTLKWYSMLKEEYISKFLS